MGEYRELKKLNQSLLKEILISPKAFLEAKRRQETSEKSDQEHFIFGTMVDIMLTGTKEEFDKKFFRVADDVKCSESVKAIVDGVFDEASQDITPVEDLDKYPDLIVKHCRYLGYQPKWGDEAKVKAIVTAGAKYFDVLRKGVGKTLVSETEYSNAVSCKVALQVDQFTRPFVDRKYDIDVEFLDKPIVEFELNGLEIKGELDRVVINHATQLITPIDFKTTGKSIHGFESDFWYYRYDFQAATYRTGLPTHSRIKELLKAGYTLGPFHYIVVEKSLKNAPLIFIVTPEVHTIGLAGGERSNGKILDGLTQALARYKYAEENNAWDYPMEYYENNGRVMIEV
jgi:hypothetical protein